METRSQRILVMVAVVASLVVAGAIMLAALSRTPDRDSLEVADDLPTSRPTADASEASDGPLDDGPSVPVASPTPTDSPSESSPEASPSPTEASPSPAPSAAPSPTPSPSPSPSPEPSPVPPRVAILSPDDDSTACQGDAIQFVGEAQDDQPLLDESFTWRSDVEGTLGTGPEITRGLQSLGQHFITLQVTDQDGQTASDAIGLRVLASDEPACQDEAPTVSITSPKSGTRHRAEDRDDAGPYATVVVTAEVTDDRDAPANLTYEWVSDRDGTVLQSRDGSVRLHTEECGTVVHRLTLQVTDSSGNTSTDEVQVTIADDC